MVLYESYNLSWKLHRRLRNQRVASGVSELVNTRQVIDNTLVGNLSLIFLDVVIFLINFYRHFNLFLNI